MFVDLKHNNWLVRVCFLAVLVFCSFCYSRAQQRVLPKQMSFLPTPKANSIFYNDTFYNGSMAYRKLFYNTKDPQIIELYKKHQINKVLGSALGAAGSIALTVGVIYASGNHQNISRGTGWAMLGSGLVAAITGGYLIKCSTSNLLFATYYFNKRYTNPKASIGISGDGVSFVVKL